MPINPTHRTFNILWAVQAIYWAVQEQGTNSPQYSQEINHDSLAAWQWKHLEELC